MISVWYPPGNDDMMIWMFPKIGGSPPKWMVYNSKTNGMIWGENPLFSERSISVSISEDLPPPPSRPRAEVLRCATAWGTSGGATHGTQHLFGHHSSTVRRLRLVGGKVDFFWGGCTGISCRYIIAIYNTYVYTFIYKYIYIYIHVDMLNAHS